MQAAGPYETLNLSAPPSRKRCRVEAAHAAPHGIGRPIELSVRCLVLAIARCQSVVYAAVVTPRVCRESASWQRPGIALTCALRRSPHHPRSPLLLSLDARMHECSRGNRSRRGPEGPIKPDCWSACLDLCFAVGCAASTAAAAPQRGRRQPSHPLGRPMAIGRPVRRRWPLTVCAPRPPGPGAPGWRSHYPSLLIPPGPAGVSPRVRRACARRRLGGA